jgi:hypothetical protein
MALPPPSPCPHQQTHSAPTGGDERRCRPRIVDTPTSSAECADGTPRNECQAARGHPQSRGIGLSTGTPFPSHEMRKTRRHSTTRTRAVEPRLNRAFRQPQPLVRSIAAGIGFQAACQSEPRRQEHRQTNEHRPSPGAQTLIVRVKLHRIDFFRGRHGVLSGVTGGDKTECGFGPPIWRFPGVLPRHPALSAVRIP